MTKSVILDPNQSVTYPDGAKITNCSDRQMWIYGVITMKEKILDQIEDIHPRCTKSIKYREGFEQAKSEALQIILDSV